VEREPWHLVSHASFDPIFLLRVLFSVVQPSSRFEFRLYGERLARRDVLLGTHEMISIESQTGWSLIRILLYYLNHLIHPGIDVPFVLANGDIKAGQLVEPITLYLTFNVSPNATPSLALSITAPNLQSTEVNASTHKGATSYIAPDSTNVVRSTVATDRGTVSSPTDRIPSIPMPAAADPRAEMSSAEHALQIANEAMTTISLSDTWEVALERIKWVMETVSPVAEVRSNILLPILG
jgi:hypothetical protein